MHNVKLPFMRPCTHMPTHMHMYCMYTCMYALTHKCTHMHPQPLIHSHTGTYKHIHTFYCCCCCCCRSVYNSVNLLFKFAVCSVLFLGGRCHGCGHCCRWIVVVPLCLLGTVLEGLCQISLLVFGGGWVQVSYCMDWCS